MPPEETVITRDGAAASSAGVSRRVSRNGATTWPRNVISVPARVRAELGVDGACVVDEHVEPVMGGIELAGEVADRIEVLQIGQPVADARAAGRGGDAAPGPLSPAAIAGEEVDRRAPPGQRDGGRVPDPGGRAGDEDGPPVEAGWSSAVYSGSSRDRTARPIREKPGTTPASRAASTAGPNRSRRVSRRGAAPPDRTGVSADVPVPAPGRPDRTSASPAAARSATTRKPGRRTGSSTCSGPRSRTSAS